MDIQKIKLEKIQINKDNPRTITKEKFDKLVNSILVFPKMLEIRPIVVDGNFIALGGNQRTEALKAISKMEIATISERLTSVSDFQRMDKSEQENTILFWGAWLDDKVVPIINASRLTEDEKRQFIVKDNAGFGEWNFAELAEKWDASSLNEWGVDFPENWDLPEEESKEAKEDDFTEEDAANVETRVKLGEIWQLGEHLLMCGDSTKKEDVERLLNGEKADMVFTDPPYGYQYVSNYQDKFEMIENDDKILDFVRAIKDYINKDIGIYSFCGWQSVDLWMQYFKTTCLQLKNMIIWKKNNWSMGDLEGSYAGQYEIVLYLTNGRAILNGGRDTDIWEFNREPPKLHPTMKPIDLISYALNKSSNQCDIVLDVFGGSGSTLIACELLNRKCRMMELSERYCDVIIARWEKLTGKEAVKIHG